jgi:ankyrin repeat protein
MAAAGHKNIVQLLLDSYGITALMYAAHSGSTSTVELLLDRNANVNVKATSLGYRLSERGGIRRC